MAGYSKTPLAAKLGIKPGSVVCAVNPPAGYLDLLAPLPENARVVHKLKGEADIIHFFSADRDELERSLPQYLKQIRQNGMIWISWPKKTSGMPSTITEHVVREIALPLGLVDVKVCAVDEVWSGLKLVIRLENRTS